jgi:hypothetical protein
MSYNLAFKKDKYTQLKINDPNSMQCYLSTDA